MATIELKIEFGGGLELLFGNQRTHVLSLPTTVPRAPRRPDAPTSAIVRPRTPTGTGTGAGDADADAAAPDVSYLIRHLRTHVLTERPELFSEGDTVYVTFPPLGVAQRE